MKKIIVWIISSVLLISSWTFAQEINYDKVNKIFEENEKLLNTIDIEDTTKDTINSIELVKPEKENKPPVVKEIPPKKFTMQMKENMSCETLNKEFNDYLKQNKNYFNKQRNYFLSSDDFMVKEFSASSNPWNILTETLSANKADTKKVAESSSSESQWEYSKTNIQKENVDEPDILKISNDVFAYLHDNTIEIVKWNKENRELVSSTKLPESLRADKLLLYKNKLIVLWERYKENKNWYDNASKTSVLILNLVNPSKPSIEQFIEFNWFFDDARLINNILYVFNNAQISFPYNIMEQGDINLKQLLPNTTTSYIDSSKIKVENKEPKCENVSLLLPDSSTLEKYGFNFTFQSVISINLDNYSTHQKFLMGSWFERHMSQKGLYLTSQVWEERKFKCEDGFRCWFPTYFTENYTQIHKFNINNKNWSLKYAGSNLISGSPLNQYSMDEDEKWNFRIITSDFWKWTSVFVLDKELNVVGNLTWIQPNEQFKSSRFIGDKLYLVTFEQTDPLFVIDVSENKSPTILGELKIPWFSTYLHPYGKIKNGKQLLIWVWYDTKTEEKITKTTGLKIDVYEIDYTSNPLSVKQIWTKTIWEQWTYSPILRNPRSFVWNEKTKELIFPLLETKNEKQEVCNYTYIGSLKEKNNCYERQFNTPTFYWTKVLTLKENWAIEEKDSINALPNILESLIEEYNNKNENKISTDEDKKQLLRLNDWEVQNKIENSRAWYVWTNYFNIDRYWYREKELNIRFPNTK